MRYRRSAQWVFPSQPHKIWGVHKMAFQPHDQADSHHGRDFMPISAEYHAHTRELASDTQTRYRVRVTRSPESPHHNHHCKKSCGQLFSSPLLLRFVHGCAQLRWGTRVYVTRSRLLAYN